MDDKPLTTGEVADYCHVSPVAVWKWIKKGKLKAYRLPGGHYRVEKQALKAFLIDHDIPVDPAFFAHPERRILVVDDEPSVVEIASRALQQLGEDVVLASAGDGFEAGLQVATFRPHLLILDLMMPQIDGFEVCRMIRENPATAHVKILIITAYGNHHNIQQALASGANDFMHKPLDIQQLKDKAQTMLAE